MPNKNALTAIPYNMLQQEHSFPLCDYKVETKPPTGIYPALSKYTLIRSTQIDSAFTKGFQINRIISVLFRSWILIKPKPLSYLGKVSHPKLF